MIAATPPDAVLALSALMPFVVALALAAKQMSRRVTEHEHQLREVHQRMQSNMDLIVDATAGLYASLNQMKGKPRPGKEWVEYDPILAAGADIVPEFEQTIVGWMSASGAERISRDTTSWYGWDAMFELSSPIPVAWVAEYGESSEEPQPIIETVLRWRRCDVAAGETWLPAPKDLTPL